MGDGEGDDWRKGLKGGRDREGMGERKGGGRRERKKWVRKGKRRTRRRMREGGKVGRKEEMER